MDCLEFEKNLEIKYPEIFKHTHCGIRASEGWHHIIEDLCHRIHDYMKITQNNVKTQCPPVKVKQIKEKFEIGRAHV